ncbi:MAG: haloacid dehalogenase type II [Chromatiaceae bacterium]|jgi:2-haloacid dehalogenase|nr:haloacid dehalogenase type II [Chromatiaceae bacterium]
MRRTIVFDVNETLLDLGVLRPHFDRIFGDENHVQTWFGLLLRNAMVTTILGGYQDFSALGREALMMTAERLGKIISETDREAILEQMRCLPPHPDVTTGLARLQAAGFRLATLTNNPAPVLEQQLSNAGLLPYFDMNISVDAVRCFKPSPVVYQHAARELDIPVSRIRLVAAHDWDVAGAISAGCAAAFVARPGAVLGTLRPVPDIVETDLVGVAQRIVDKD